MRRLSGLDASFLYSESERMPLHAIKVGIFELAEDIPLTRLRDEIAAHFTKISALHKRLVWVPLGLFHPQWRDGCQVDIAQHVDLVTLRYPEELDQVIAAVAQGMLPRDRPLWQLTLVSGLGERRLAAILKIHHALADGAAVAMMLRRLSTLGPTHPRKSTLPPRGPLPPRALLLLTGLLARAQQLLALPSLLSRTLRGTMEPRHRPRMLFRGPMLRMNGRLVRTRRFLRFHMPLDRFAALARSSGCSVNDVVFAAAAGAFRQWLLEGQEDVSRPLVASMPVGVGRKHVIGNWVSNSFVPIPVHLSTAEERLAFVHEQIALAKRAQLRRGASLFSEWAELGFPLLHWAVWNGFAPRFKRPPINMVLSNVRGPEEERYVGTARLVELYSVGPLVEPVGVNLTVWSYAGRLYFSLLSTPRMVRRHRLPELFARALSELEASLAASGLEEQPAHPRERSVLLPGRDHPAR